MDDASLDDFLGDADSDGDESAAAAGATDEETADTDADTVATDSDDESPHVDPGTVDPGTVDPAVSTYAWSDRESPCAACGEPVRVRWQDEVGLVCAACKDW